MRRTLTILIVGLAAELYGLCGTAPSSDWMFRRSYYSHAAGPAPGVGEPESRVVYRQPWMGAHPRLAVRGGWRYNTMVLQNGTSGSDRTIIREYWTDFNY